MSAKNEIQFNNKVYNFIVDCAEYYLKKCKIEKSILFCQAAATYATFNYCGFYSELRLENVLLELSRKFIKLHNSNNIRHQSTGSSKKILHYATSIHSVGGHTKLIENWIKNDSNNKHDIVLTEQKDDIPDFVKVALDLVGGRIINIDNTIITNKATEVYILSKDYDIIVLHHHANDIIPVLSFGLDGQMPVCVLNHGDHRYWLGVTICDILIEIRDNLIKIDEVRRKINNFSLLPIPIEHGVPDEDKYTKARLKLGIKEDDIMLLSIGASYKYIPIDNRNFFEDISSTIRNSRVKLYIVGIRPDEELALNYKNIIFIAPTPELDDYRNACDIYLEGYPFSSFTAYLEVAAISKPIHRMYNPPLLNEYRLLEYPNKINFPISKEDWVLKLSELIASREKRLSQGFLDKENSLMHGVENWKKQLQLFYDKAEKTKHCVKKVKADRAVFLSKNDVYLHKMQNIHVLNISLNNFYDLPIYLKAKLIALNEKGIIYSNKLSLRDIIWFVFKSKNNV